MTIQLSLSYFRSMSFEIKLHAKELVGKEENSLRRSFR